MDGHRPRLRLPAGPRGREDSAAGVGLDLERGLGRIIVTHLHPDHIGLARWLEERSGAPVWMLEGRSRTPFHVWDPERGHQGLRRLPDAQRHGRGDRGADGRLHAARRPCAGAPDPAPAGRRDRARRERITGRAHAGALRFPLRLARRATPAASSPETICCSRSPRTSGSGPTRRRGPSAATRTPFRGCGSWRGPRLPGSRPALSRTRRAHRRAPVASRGAPLGDAFAAFDGESATPFEVALRVFPEDLSDHQLRFALAETLAHLEHLEEDGASNRRRRRVATGQSRPLLASQEEHARLVQTARGDRPADLFVRGGTIANVYSGELHEGKSPSPGAA